MGLRLATSFILLLLIGTLAFQNPNAISIHFFSDFSLPEPAFIVLVLVIGIIIGKLLSANSSQESAPSQSENKPASSNSNRLVEVASRLGVPAYLIQNEDDIDPDWITDVDCAGVTAGASTPDVLVQGVLRRLKDLSKDGATLDSLPEIDEGIRFKLPRELRDA